MCFSFSKKFFTYGWWLDDFTLHVILRRTDIFCFDQGKPPVRVGPLRTQGSEPNRFTDKARGPSRRRQPVAEQKPETLNDFTYSPHDGTRMCGE